MIACMGGFCGSRDICAHYHATGWKRKPLERLCGEREDPVYIDTTRKLHIEAIENEIREMRE